jgi:RHS repeat-associated protein
VGDSGVLESYAYDEFGCDTLGNQGQLQPFGYTGYQYDTIAQTYFAQAREYVPHTGRFVARDIVKGTISAPLTMNEYSYCLNNPVQFLDPSGLTIELGDHTQRELEEYNRAIAYLKTSETGRALVERLENESSVFRINFVNNDDMFYDPLTRNIYFDPASGMIVGDGTSVQSAALGLAHEMGHAAQDLDGELPEFPTNNDIRAVETANVLKYETPVAQQLGEPIRDSYDDGIGTFRMNNSTHFKTTYKRPWYHYIWPGNWGKPRIIITDHNVGLSRFKTAQECC